jgi:hypothetical protein
MKFCPYCGSPVVAGARFCVECGKNLAASQDSSLAQPVLGATSKRPTPAFLGVFGGILLIGVAATLVVMRYNPNPNRSSGFSAAGSDKTGNELPAGHPAIHLPQQAIDFIAKLKHTAEASPGNIAAWDRLGDVTSRAALFDPKYYAESEAAYGHVLKLDPENLDALRGIGNINYDLHRYDQAIAAYEHYLSHKPDDPDVLTDLGTMYLSTGNAPQAVLTYKRALLAKPDFYQAWFNLGVAYDEENREIDAKTSFERALALAPDATTRKQAQQALAALQGSTAQPNVASSVVAASTAPTLAGAVEQLVRALPIAGPKVKTVQWPAANHVRIAMAGFPMDSMPPFARTKFLDDLKSSVRSAMAAHHVSGPLTVDIVNENGGGVMQSVIVTNGDNSTPATTATETNADASSATAGSRAATGNGFQDAVANAIRAIPFAGRKVDSIQWLANNHAKVLMNNFPMDEMPPFARTKFIDDLKAGVQSAKEANRVTGPVEIDIADNATGQVMQSVTQ